MMKEKRMKGRFMIHMFVITLLFIFGCSKEDPVVVPPPEHTLSVLGFDASYLPEVRQSGLPIFNQDSVQQDMLVTLKNAGVNVIRLRLWKDPVEPTSGFETVKAFSTEIKSMGMKVMLTVHYSDSWADPGKQDKPGAWHNATLEQLNDSVYTYTKKIMQEIQPDYIAIGNEINSGFLWPEGHISHFDQMKQLLKSGIKAVREANPSTQIILHHAGYQNADYFFGNLSDLSYDIIGLSYYPIWHSKDLYGFQQAMTALSQNLNKKILLAETAYPFTFGYNDLTTNIIGSNSQILPDFPATPQGQWDYLEKIKTIMTAVPTGIGFCYWGGEWISYKGMDAHNGSSWENQACWNFNNKALPVLNAYQIALQLH